MFEIWGKFIVNMFLAAWALLFPFLMLIASALVFYIVYKIYEFIASVFSSFISLF